MNTLTYRMLGREYYHYTNLTFVVGLNGVWYYELKDRNR